MPLTIRQAFLLILAGAVLTGCGSEETPDSNAAPIAVADSETGAVDTDISITLVGHDSDGDLLAYQITNQPLYGTLAGTPPNIIYTPNTAYEGQDQFSFKVNDGELDSNEAIVNLGVGVATAGQPNQAPTADDLTISLVQDTSTAVTLAGEDVDGDALSFRVMSAPTYGSLSGTAPHFTYTPDSAYVGADSFTYASHDGELEGVAARVDIIVTAVVVTSTLIAPLNDTGITSGAYGSIYGWGNSTTCTGIIIAEQDCQRGRDATHNDDSDGHAGFSYTKLDVNGFPLDASAEAWSCVKDNVTGLTWEVKVGGNFIQGDEGLHDADDGYSWYNTDFTTNGGSDGVANIGYGTCSGYDVNDEASYCNTEAYVARVNAVGLCGATDWRMPSKTELLNLNNLSRIELTIDADYFPSRSHYYYQSSTPHINDTDYAKGVSFRYGETSSSYHGYDYAVRLVRVGR